MSKVILRNVSIMNFRFFFNQKSIFYQTEIFALKTIKTCKNMDKSTVLMTCIISNLLYKVILNAYYISIDKGSPIR